MRSEIILSGIGGQGIVMMGEYLGRAAMKSGHKVTIAPAYGQEKRGSYVRCQVTISDELISPSISKADAVLVMDDESFDLYERRVKAGGYLLINSDIVTRKSAREDIIVINIPLSALALQAGSAKSANIVGLGALAKCSGIVSLETVQEVMKEKMKPAILDMNLKALEIGYGI